MVTKELMIVLATLMLAFFVMACIGVIIKNEPCVMFGAGFMVAFFALFLYFAVAKPRVAVHKKIFDGNFKIGVQNDYGFKNKITVAKNDFHNINIGDDFNSKKFDKEGKYNEKISLCPT